MLETVDPELLNSKVAVMATLGPTGMPQLTAVWFAVEDNRVLVSVNAKRQKVANVAANDRVSMLMFHPASNDYFVEIRGRVRLVADDDYAIADRIAPRYGADFRAFDQPGEGRFIIELTPTKVLVTDVR
jgi:PPOX class probable F420-dependent enzyme